MFKKFSPISSFHSTPVYYPIFKVDELVKIGSKIPAYKIAEKLKGKVNKKETERLLKIRE